MVAEKNKQKVLILGARGNLGIQLANVFQKQYDVTAWDKEEIDITDKELITKKVNDIRPDVIINAAAYNSVDKCEKDDAEYELAKKINIDGPKYLAAAAKEIRAILVHYSTDYVFEGKNKKGYKEIDEPHPVNRYGKSKLHGEKRVLELSGAGLKWYLIRTSKLFGPKGKSEIAKLSFFDTMLKSAKEKSKINVVNEEVSCFTYTPDLAKATRDLVESDPAFVPFGGISADKKGYGIYHITNSGACTWYEAAKELFRIAGVNIKVNPVTSDKFSRSAKRPKYSVLLNTKLEPLRDWQEALKEYLKSNL